MRARCSAWLLGAIAVVTTCESELFALQPPIEPPLSGRAVFGAQFDCTNCEESLEGDFDGDGFPDSAWPTREFVNAVPGKMGIQVRVGGNWIEISAGRRSGGAPDDFRGVSAWWVVPHAKLTTLWRGSPCPRGDAIWVQNRDNSAGLLAIVKGRAKWRWLRSARRKV